MTDLGKVVIMNHLFSDNRALESTKMIGIWTALIGPEKKDQKLLKIQK